MKERLTNNLGLKILSIFLAFFVWLVVVNVSNPEVSRNKEVQLEIENENVLSAAGRTYELSGKNTVTVTYDVRTRDEYKVRATDFRAYIDLAELYDVTGSVPVKIEVLNNKEIIYNASSRPGVARIKTEELQRKRFELSVVQSGEPAEEYALNGVVTNPQYVYVEGPISQVGLISDVGVEVSVEGLKEDADGITAPTFYDANGNRLPLGERVRVDRTEISYHVSVSKVKKLSLDFEVAGTAANGYQYAGLECDTKTISVVGLRTNLASLNKITVPAAELNVDGATADKVVQVNLEKYLPEGVEFADAQNPVIEIRLRVEPLKTKVYRIQDTQITQKGISELYQYRLNPVQLEVTLQGLEEDLNSLTAESLGAAIDLTGILPGVHKGSLILENKGDLKVITYTEFTVEVIEKAEEEETQGTETAQSPTTEAEETSESEGTKEESVAG